VRPTGSPVSQLFKDGLALGTLLIWTTFFMSLLVFYLLSSWLPLLITTAGFSMEHASLMGATLAAGGTVGAILIGRLMDRFEPHRVLAGAYLVAGAFVILLGSAVATPWLLVVAIFGAGFGVAGAQVGINALAAGYYPTASRATGVSWANAVGRTGSVLGSMIGGVLLSLGWDLAMVFAAAACPPSSRRSPCSPRPGSRGRRSCAPPRRPSPPRRSERDEARPPRSCDAPAGRWPAGCAAPPAAALARHRRPGLAAPGRGTRRPLPRPPPRPARPRAHGRHPRPLHDRGHGADVLAALDALGIDRLPVAGLSIGGMIAQSLAHQAPAASPRSSSATPRSPSRPRRSGASGRRRSAPAAWPPSPTACSPAG
jgi:hypothetical protein